MAVPTALVSLGATFAKYVILLAVLIFLGYVIAMVPEYRFYALIGVLCIVVVFFRLWRFLPTEKRFIDNEIQKRIDALEQAQPPHRHRRLHTIQTPHEPISPYEGNTSSSTRSSLAQSAAR